MPEGASAAPWLPSRWRAATLHAAVTDMTEFLRDSVVKAPARKV
jgi:hypothetical protein